MEFEDRSRPLNDLPQMPRERPKASLLFRSRARRRSRAVAKTRADLGATHRAGRPRREVGAPQSNQRAPGNIADRTGGGRWLDRLEERIDPTTASNRNRRSAV